MAQLTRAPTSDFATGGTVAYSSGTTGYNLVNDYPDTADPLTSYVTLGTTANSFIAFNFTAFAVPANSVVNWVEVQYTDEEPSNGANTAAARLRVNATYYNASTHNPSTTTTSRADRWTTNPNTTAAWTVDDVNGSGAAPLQNFGVIGPDSNPVWRVGSIQIVVDYTPPVEGTSTGSFSVSVSATGKVEINGSSTGSFSLSGSATGTVETAGVAGTSTGSFSIGGSASAYVANPLRSYIGSFTMNTTTGEQTISGVGFEPKLVILFSNMETSGAGHAYHVIGAFTDQTACGIGMAGKDGIDVASETPNVTVAYSVNQRDLLAEPVLRVVELFSGTFWLETTTARFRRMTSDGFVLNFTANKGVASRTVQFLALGGNITARVGKLPSIGGTGYKSVSVGFQPSALLLFWVETQNKSIEACYGFGAAVSAAKQWSTYVAWSDITNTTSRGLLSSSNCIEVNQPDGETQYIRASLASMDSAGFTLNFGTYTTVVMSGFFVAIAGVDCDCGVLTQPTSTGDQDVTSTVAPEVVVFGSRGQNAAATYTTGNAKMFLGCARPGLSNSSVTGSSTNGVSTSEAAAGPSSSRSIRIISGATGSVDCDAEVTQANGPNGFRINWTTADATQREFAWLAIKPGNTTVAMVAAPPFAMPSMTHLLVR